MFLEKSSLIKTNGQEVFIYSKGSKTEDKVSVISVLGRISVQASRYKLESYKRFLFPNDSGIVSGYYTDIAGTGETYLITVVVPEIVQSTLVAYRCEGVKCNGTISIYSIVKDANDYGHITTTESLTEDNVPCYIRSLKGDVIQYQPGKLIEADFLIHAPTLNTSVMDKISISLGGEVIPLKLVANDTAAYEGISLLTVDTETRG